jgi:two-component system CheB/CheR fusion protein
MSTESNVIVASSKKSCSRCRVLLVDDHEEFALSLQALLVGNGCEVHMARSGRRALQLAASSRFDAVILDIRLPDLSGYTLVRELRMKPAYSQALIMGLTGWRPEGAPPVPVESGFDHFLLKPVDFEAVEGIFEATVCSRNNWRCK